MSDQKVCGAYLEKARMITVDWNDNLIVDDIPAVQSDDARRIFADIEQWRQELKRKGGDDVD